MPLSPDKLERLLYGQTIPDSYSKQRLEEARSTNMPDLKTALQEALNRNQQDSVNTALLNAWDKDTADSKAQQGETNVPTTTFPVTSNISRNLFNLVRDNPGIIFHDIKKKLTQHNPNSLGSLLTQMVNQGMLKREGEHLRYKYYALITEYRPIKARRTKKADVKRKVVTIVRPKIKDNTVTIETLHNVSPSTAGLAALANADARQVSGDHYKAMPIQPWSVMESVLTREEFIGYLKGNVVKYAMRAGRKEGSDDAGKAQHYQQKLDEILRK
jgi:hypothetical protein